jgi:hypothetical protein
MFLDDSNSQQGQDSSEDPNGGRTLFAIIPQQGAALDQTTINTLLNLANDQEKLNANPQGLLLASMFPKKVHTLSLSAIRKITSIIFFT